MKCLALALVGLGVFAPLSHGGLLVYTGVFSGANEFPVVSTTGTGFAVVTFDDVANSLRVQATFSDLVLTGAGTTNAHIHCCALPGSNAGVATPTPTFPGFPAGVRAGSYDQTFDLTLTSSFNGAFIAANGGTTAGARAALVNGLNNGSAYMNIHSAAFPGGEIRANLSLVPEPSTMALGGLALAGLLAARRRVRD